MKSTFQYFFKARKLISVYPPVQASAAGLKVRTLSLIYSTRVSSDLFDTI